MSCSNCENAKTVIGVGVESSSFALILVNVHGGSPSGRMPSPLLGRTMHALCALSPTMSRSRRMRTFPTAASE